MSISILNYIKLYSIFKYIVLKHIYKTGIECFNSSSTCDTEYIVFWNSFGIAGNYNRFFK